MASFFKVKIRKRVRKGKYVERRITVPVDFPEKEEAILLTPEDFEEIISGKCCLIDGKYYVLCKECGGIAHLTVESLDGRAWYYCPRCNMVFQA